MGDGRLVSTRLEPRETRGSPVKKARVASLLLTCLALVSCGRPEDPARTELRQRLTQKPSLSSEELARVRNEVGEAIVGKHIRIMEGEAAHELDEDQRTVVLGMLTNAAGMYDEGLRQESGTTFRILNAPGVSPHAEIEAARKLWIEVETFLPRRFDFVYAFPGYGDYSFNLAVD